MIEQGGLEKLGIGPEKIGPLIDQIDAAGIVTLIPLRAAWSDRESDKFFAQPERRPFTTEIKLSPELLTTVGKYLKQTDSGLLRSFIPAATYYLMVPGVYKLEDERVGLDREAVRREEKPGPNEELLSLFREEAGGVALEKILAASERGSLEAAWDSLIYYQGDPAVRRVLERVIARRETDIDLNRQQLQLVWQAESLRLEMGISLDEWCRLNNNGQSVNEIVKSLQNFLTDPKQQQEWQRVFGKEAGGAGDFWEMLEKRAVYNHLPEKTETPEERQQKIIQAEAEVRPYFPESGGKDPRMESLLTDKFGASSRPFTMSYYNRLKEWVRVEINNSRQNLNDLIIWLGHEKGGHGRQIRLLEEATKEGKFNVNPWPKMPGWLKEQAAMLVEDQFRQKFKQGPDLLKAYQDRRNAVQGLTQMAVRQEMERLWNQGVRQLTREQADEIIEQATPQIHHWFKQGLGIDAESLSLLNNLNPLDAFDGTKYLSGGSELIGIFRGRFGDFWLGNPEAMKKLDEVMVEMGRVKDWQSLLAFARG